MIFYKLKQLYRFFKNWVFPRQRWLTKKIPYSWADKDTIMELVILECITHYVEEERVFETVSPSEYTPSVNVFLLELEKIYDDIKVQIPLLESKLELEWKNVPLNSSASYEYKYGKIDELEQKIEDLKTGIMLWAVKNRNFIWT